MQPDSSANRGNSCLFGVILIKTLPSYINSKKLKISQEEFETGWPFVDMETTEIAGMLF